MTDECTVHEAMSLIRSMLILRTPRVGAVMQHPADRGRMRFFVDPLLPEVITVEPREHEIYMRYLDGEDEVRAYLPLDRAQIVRRLTPVITRVLADAGLAREDDDD